MSKILPLAAIALGATVMTLPAAPSSHAQLPVGVGVNVGPIGIRVGGLVPAYPVAPPPVYVPAPAPFVYPAPYPAYVAGPSVVVRAGFPVWGPHDHYYWRGRHHRW